MDPWVYFPAPNKPISNSCPLVKRFTEEVEGWIKVIQNWIQTNIKHWIMGEWSWDTKSLPLGGWKEGENNNKASIWQIFLSYNHLPCSVFQYVNMYWKSAGPRETKMNSMKYVMRVRGMWTIRRLMCHQLAKTCGEHFSYVYLKIEIGTPSTIEITLRNIFSRTNQWVSRQRCIPQGASPWAL